MFMYKDSLLMEISKLHQLSPNVRIYMKLTTHLRTFKIQYRTLTVE